MRYLENVEKNVKLFGSRLAATLDFNEEPMTYADLWEISGRTYRFLKEQGIGKEDFVLIRLPRGPKPMAVILGVFRAGAAFTIVEDIYPEERIAYIEKDCGCRLRIDLPVYEQILETEPLAGFEEADPHDACFAIYTSGTTGNPKGVLHEYGKLDYTIRSIPKEFEKKEDIVEKFAAIMPMNFVAFLFVVIAFFYNGDTVYIVSFQVAKNFVRYTELLEQERITECFMSPSMIRVYRKPADSLKIIATGSEPANGIYYGKPVIYNIYAMSESGMAIAGFLIDKPYDKAPVGKNTTGSKIVILGEDAQELSQGQEGEICFENDYFRGYLHLPEETQKAFRGGIFHTGDLGYLDENGNLLISGRSDDMIKINGNRIEPAEIEAAAKDILHVQNAVAKGFDEDGSAYVALYCLKSEVGGQLDEDRTEALRKEMEKRLPHYMIPSYYVALDELPVNPNGKVVRKLLKSPRAAALKREYVEPHNDTEKLLCMGMAKVLGLEKVGVTEDFFYLGGDSLKTIQLVSGLEEAGVLISAENVYDGRSAEKIAKLVEASASMTEEEWEKAEKEAEGMQLALLHGQWQMIQDLSVCEHPSSGLNTAIKLQKGVDAARLQEAADRVLSVHPALRTRLVLHEDGTYTQQYVESLYDGVRLFETEEEEAQEEIRKMTDRYGLHSQRMSYSAVVKTPENVYFVLLLSHIIMDGEGQKLLLNQIYQAYQNQDYRPGKDYYFAILKNTLDRQKEKLEASQAYYDSMFSSHTVRGLKPDHESTDRTPGMIYIKDFMKADPRLDNVFFLTAYALAAAKYNGTGDALIYSLYHGRDDKYRMAAAGYLLQETFISLKPEKEDTPVSLMEKVRASLAAGVSSPSSMYLMNQRDDISDMARFIYQKNMRTGAGAGSFGVEQVKLDETLISIGRFTINIVEQDGHDHLSLLGRYAKACYEEESIQRFLGLFKEAIQYLMTQ